VSAKSFRRDDTGSSAIEFAYLMPVFLGLVIGVLWFGWVAQGLYSVHYGLTQSARALQLNPAMTQAQLQALVRSKINVSGNVNDVTVTLVLDAASGGAQVARATATYPIEINIPLIGDYSTTYTVSIAVPVVAS
jgi:Flp pilus assembly protein TadG